MRNEGSIYKGRLKQQTRTQISQRLKDLVFLIILACKELNLFANYQKEINRISNNFSKNNTKVLNTISKFLVLLHKYFQHLGELALTNHSLISMKLRLVKLLGVMQTARLSINLQHPKEIFQQLQKEIKLSSQL